MRINKHDTQGTKPLLGKGELGYDDYAAGGDVGRVYVGTGSENIALAEKSEIDSHVNRVDNPHNVTKAQVGLGDVDNTADVNKNVLSATKWTTARTITLSGDVAGSVSMDGTANVSITTTVQPNSVALGTDTTGNYVAGATAGTGISVTGTAGEGWSPTIAIDSTVATLTGAQTLTNKTLQDSTTFIVDNTDATKKVQFDVAGVTTATTRTLTVPNVNGTIITTGDTGTVTSTMIADGTIVNADINASAAIVDTKLATISTAGKVSNSATTATNLNTANAIVARDASGNFSAGTITASLSGNSSTATALATGRTIGMTGDVTWTSASFDGTGNVTGAATLATVTDSGTGTFKKITVDTKGRVTGTAAVAQSDITGLLGAGSITNTMLANSAVANLSGTNTGDETTATIKTKLGISTLSGSNTGDQTITLTGDVTGTGTGSFAATLANTTVVAGTYGSATLIPTITVDSKGRLTGVSTNSVSVSSGSISVTGGDLTMSGTTGTDITNATLASVGTAGTYTKVTTDAKGRITSGTTLSAEDVPSLGWSKITTGKPTTLAGYNIGDAYTKTEVDSLLQGLKAKASVIVATTANITLSGTQTIDGVAVTAGQRVLVKNQTTASQNGIYVCSASAWSRATDADTSTEIMSAYVFVEQGTANQDTAWVMNTDSVVLNTTALTWVKFAGSGAYAATSHTHSAANITSGTLAVTVGGTGTTSSTGTGSVVLSTSPTLVTPNIGVATGTSFNGITALSSTTPNMDGVASIGTSTTVARADHTHASDSTKANLSGDTFTGPVTGVSFNNITALSSSNPLVADTAAIGTSTTVARADHVHPAQTTITGNAGTATALATGRTISITGDVSYTSGSFNGSANVTGTATLANSGVTAGTYTKVTVDSKGRVTGGASTTASDVGLGNVTNESKATMFTNPTFTGTATGTFSGTFSGSLSGNATTAGGLAVATGTNNVANQIVRTDGNGYIQCGYIQSSGGNEHNNASPSYVWGTNGSDNYMRTYNTSYLSVNYANTSGSCSGNAATATTAANADMLDGLHAYSFLREDGWDSSPGKDANTQENMKVDFTYANNAPYVGPLVNLGVSDYLMQFNGTYNTTSPGLAFRTKNGDNGTWNRWRDVAFTDSNITGNAATATTASSANQLNGRNFYWSGQGGQPSWLWGGNDGTNMYVYNPSNFSVNYANTAGNGGVTSVNGMTGAVTIATGSSGSASFTSSGTWTCPAGVTRVTLTMCGGGGGGGKGLYNSSIYNNYRGGGGGGSSNPYTTVVPVTPGTVYSITIGAGGVASGNGGNTTFGNLAIAGGGYAGSNASYYKVGSGKTAQYYFNTSNGGNGAYTGGIQGEAATSASGGSGAGGIWQVSTPTAGAKGAGGAGGSNANNGSAGTAGALIISW